MLCGDTKFHRIADPVRWFKLLLFCERKISLQTCRKNLNFSSQTRKIIRIAERRPRLNLLPIIYGLYGDMFLDTNHGARGKSVIEALAFSTSNLEKIT